MALLTTKKLSSFSSRSMTTSLPDSELIQERVTFNGGFNFNFADVLSGVTDIATINHTTFFLTDKIDLSSKKKYSSIDDAAITSRTRTTSLQSLENNYYLTPVQVAGTSLFGDNIFYDVRRGVYPTSYNINYIDDTTCTVSVDTYDRAGTVFLTLSSNNTAILKRGYDVSDEEIIFNFISRNNRISLYKYNDESSSLILKFNGGVLSGVRVESEHAQHVLRNTCFGMTVQQNQKQDYIVPTDSIEFQQYSDYTVTLKNDEMYKGILSNYLVSRSLNTENHNAVDILALKNQSIDDGEIIKGNSLTLSADKSSVQKQDYDIREYTSINYMINQYSTGLDLNYLSQNKAYTVSPGENIISTPQSMYPFTQININDTKLIKCGSYGSNTPNFADKVYDLGVESISNGEYIYLCTWLSGGDVNSKWVDRYFYPALTTKQDALTGELSHTSYDAYVQNTILQNSLSASFINSNPIFDVTSNLTFKPNKTYIYDRVNFETLPSIAASNSYKDGLKNYYRTINKARGFTFACTLIPDNGARVRKISSKVNDVFNNIDIIWNKQGVSAQYIFLNSSTGKYVTVQGRASNVIGVTSNIVMNVDHLRGIVEIYINGDLITSEKVPKTKAQVLFDDLYINNVEITDSKRMSPFMSDVFLSTSPLNSRETLALSNSYNTSSGKLKFTLPTAAINIQENVSDINTLNTTRGSKSNNVDVYVTGTGLSYDLKMQIKDAINLNARDVLPMNTNISNFFIK